MNPKVSIIINCHNGGKYLREAIESVYAQTFQDWIIIFFDNASSDNSAEIAKSYNEKIKYIYHKNLISLGAARKLAVAYADTEWIAFLDSDDLWYPNKLTCQFDSLKDNDYIACYAGVQEITPAGNKIRNVVPTHSSGNILEGLLRQFEINMVTPMVRKDVIQKYGINFDPTITASEEYNFFIRLSAKGKFLVQQTLLGAYRVSPGSLTERQFEHWASERRYTLKSIESENLGIKNKYSKAFQEAEARACYYDAQNLISKNNLNEAREILWKVRYQDYRYYFLYYIAYFPYLWKILHKRSFRLKILSLIKSK
jgi:glycosyltransferase involved in cell wall biosynthesis